MGTPIDPKANTVGSDVLAVAAGAEAVCEVKADPPEIDTGRLWRS
jgi:hypothetical protein